MRCYICDEPAIGLYRRCSRFYCGTHGDVTCETCKRAPMLTVQEMAPFVNARGGGQSTALERVVPPGRAEVRGDAALAIEGVDIHNDGFRIRYGLESPSTFELGGIGADVANSALLEYLHSLEVFDDLGNRYDEGRRSGWIGLSKCGGEKSFSPRPVPGATALRLSLPQLFLHVGSIGRVATSLKLGPWQVEVPLPGREDENLTAG